MLFVVIYGGNNKRKDSFFFILISDILPPLKQLLPGLVHIRPRGEVAVEVNIF